MANVLNSSGSDAITLASALKDLVQEAQERFSGAILSPLTITLGDEFQGVICSLKEGVSLLIWFEEQRIIKQLPFKLRMVLHFGEIQTKINSSMAYGMLGPGLTLARSHLNRMKKESLRFYVSGLDDTKLEILINNTFIIFQSQVDAWTPKEAKVAAYFLQKDDYRWVAKQVGTNPTSTWRRRKSLKMNAYIASKIILNELT